MQAVQVIDQVGRFASDWLGKEKNIAGSTEQRRRRRRHHHNHA